MSSAKLIAFRLLNDGPLRYGQRYQALNEHIRSENKLRFDELTSAYLIYHRDPVSTLLDRIKRFGGIYLDNRDMVLVLDLVTLERAHIGIEYPGALDGVLAFGNSGGNALGAVSSRDLIVNALMGR